MAPGQQLKPWNAQQYVLAALGGTLAATAVVVVVSVILSPARISISIAHASRSNSSVHEGAALCLNLTVVARNGSQRRAAVRYQSVFVAVRNGTSPETSASIPAKLDDTNQLTKEFLPAGSVAAFDASAVLVHGDWIQSFSRDRMDVGGGGLIVVVTAQVRFKIGVARTRLYDLKVSCPNVVFPEHSASPAPAPPATSQTVGCL